MHRPIERQIRARPGLIHARGPPHIVSSDISENRVGEMAEMATRNGQNQNWHYIEMPFPLPRGTRVTRIDSKVERCALCDPRLSRLPPLPL